MTAMTRLSIALLAASVFARPIGGIAEERHDHERARAAREAGSIMPLAALLARVAEEVPGDVLEVELEEEGAKRALVYEIKILAPGGRIRKLYYDAATGEPVAGSGMREKHGRKE